MSLTAPFLAAMLFVRVLMRQESLQDFKERIGFASPKLKDHTIWFHAASNGEWTAAKPVLTALKARTPDQGMLLTCNSLSAKRMLKGWNIKGAHVRLAPLDLRWGTRRMLARARVQTFVLFEGDFWPNRVIAAHKLGVKCVLVGGRISEGSARTWARFSSLSRRMFSAFDRVFAQDEASQARLVNLGVQPNVFGETVMLKALHQTDHLLDHAPDRALIWLAASTHEGEDAILLDAHSKARQSIPHLRMILAPRHPKRGDDITKQARSMGFIAEQRSKTGGHRPACDVFIADTLGEMEAWYRACGICFVAGSLVAKGGHTPFEPLSFGCAILHGPHLENFETPYAALQKNGGSIQCANATEISAALIRLQDQDTLRALKDAAGKVPRGSQNLSEIIDVLAN